MEDMDHMVCIEVIGGKETHSIKSRTSRLMRDKDL